MNLHPATQAKRSLLRPIAVAAAIALIATACSTGDSSVQDATVEISEGDGPEYGASLDDFLSSETEPLEGSTPPDGFEEIQWEDLIPPGFSEAEISERFDGRIAEVEPGSPEADEVFAELQAEYDNQPVNPERAGDAIQLAGFVAPITYDGELITEFLLVPYFGACVHVPPPPVNQTVMVTLQDGQGLTFDESWGAVWVTGTLTVDGAETDLATAGYSIIGAQAGIYDDY